MAPCRYRAAASSTGTGVARGRGATRRGVTPAARSRALTVLRETPCRAAMAAMVSPDAYSPASSAAGTPASAPGTRRRGRMPRARNWPRTASTPTW